jgi:hypothetical protein
MLLNFLSIQIAQKNNPQQFHNYGSFTLFDKFIKIITENNQLNTKVWQIL